jgi:hypothetical protein
MRNKRVRQGAVAFTSGEYHVPLIQEAYEEIHHRRNEYLSEKGLFGHRYSLSRVQSAVLAATEVLQPLSVPGLVQSVGAVVVNSEKDPNKTFEQSVWYPASKLIQHGLLEAFHVDGVYFSTRPDVGMFSLLSRSVDGLEIHANNTQSTCLRRTEVGPIIFDNTNLQ